MSVCPDCGCELTGDEAGLAFHENYPSCFAAVKARIAALEAENKRLRAIVDGLAPIVESLNELARDGCSVEGWDVQEWFADAGLYIRTTQIVPCELGEDCSCLEYVDTGKEATCYRTSPLLSKLLKWPTPAQTKGEKS